MLSIICAVNITVWFTGWSFTSYFNMVSPMWDTHVIDMGQKWILLNLFLLELKTGSEFHLLNSNSPPVFGCRRQRWMQSHFCPRRLKLVKFIDTLEGVTSHNKNIQHRQEIWKYTYTHYMISDDFWHIHQECVFFIHQDIIRKTCKSQPSLLIYKHHHMI